MDVYILKSDANTYQNLAPIDEGDWDLVWDKFDGTPMAASWTPLRVEVPEGDRARPPSDFPALSYVPVFSARAAQELREVLESNGELLPLDCDEGDFFAYNVTLLSNALDEDASEAERFDTDGRIMEIDRYEFRPGGLEGLTIFKLAAAPDRYEYVTDEFVGRTHDAGLVGFKFEKVWSDES